jgi:hypothetical protein
VERALTREKELEVNRRDFFSWAGKAATAIGMGYLALNSEPTSITANPNMRSAGSIPTPMRMNGSACRDFRMISADQSIFLDKDIFNA